MTDNPYSSPEDPPPPQPPRLSDARYDVTLVAMIFTGFALLYLVSLVLNLLYTYPQTGKSVLELYPFFILEIAVYGVSSAVMTWRMFQYQAVLKNINPDDDSWGEDFIAAHSSLWRTILFVLLAIVVNIVVGMTIAPGGYLNR